MENMIQSLALIFKNILTWQEAYLFYLENKPSLSSYKTGMQKHLCKFIAAGKILDSSSTKEDDINLSRMG